MAGIWDRWNDRTKGTEISTFSIVTTEANPLMAEIHNTRKRMPVILPGASEGAWLDRGADRATIESMLRSYDADKMEAYPVDRSVTKLGFNTTIPSILERKEYDGLPALERENPGTKASSRRSKLGDPRL